MHVNEIFFDTKARWRKDMKFFFYKTKKLINGICLQPFERIERIEPLEHFIDTNASKRDFFDTKALMGKYNSPHFLIQPTVSTVGDGWSFF